MKISHSNQGLIQALEALAKVVRSDPSAINAPQLLNKANAAKVLDVHPNTFGTLPIRKTKVGKSTRYDIRDINAYIAKQKTNAA